MVKNSASTAGVCEPLKKCTSLKSRCTCNNTYQNLYKRAKTIVKNNATMAFYNWKKIGIPRNRCIGCQSQSKSLQVRDGMWFPKNEILANTALWPIEFARKGLTSAGMCYSNTEREALGTLNGMKLFQITASPIAKTTKNFFVHSSIQHKNLVQTWTTAIHN